VTLSQSLFNLYIKLPFTEPEVKELATHFYKAYGILQCLGAIEGAHIEIKQPKVNSTDYLYI